MSEHAVYASNEPCWRCGLVLLEVRPPMHGWRFYCRNCEHLTSPKAELERVMAGLPTGAIGAVAAVPAHLQIEPAPAVSLQALARLAGPK